jgi:DNA-directed RNA polymerase sigma subunit (sigma70/sigma32)
MPGAQALFTMAWVISDSSCDTVSSTDHRLVSRVDGRLTDTCLDMLLDALPLQQRQVIALRYGITGEERTAEQTAADLNTSPRRAQALERVA